MPKPEPQRPMSIPDDMWWTLQIGIRVRDELSRGGYWRKKGSGGTCMSFSLTVLADAGGIRKLLEEWEQVP